MGNVRFIVLALVALMLTLFTWLGGGVVAPWLSPWTLWLTLLVAEAALLLPEQRREESLFVARQRVWRSVLRDPLTWLSLALCIYLWIQWLNSCTFLEWDVKERAWVVLSPAFDWLRHPNTEAVLAQAPADPSVTSFRWLAAPWSWLPSSLRSDEAWGVLNWFPPVLVAVLAVRHALLKRTKRRLISFICIMSSVLAIAGIIQYVVGGDFLYWGLESRAFFFATFGYPNHAACFFPAVMAVAAGMMLWTLEHHEHTHAPAWIYGVTAVLCGISSVLSGSRAGMIFAVAIVAFTVLYIPLRYFGSWSMRLRVVVPSILTLLAIAVLGTAVFRIYATRANDVRKESIKLAVTDAERDLAMHLPQFAPMPMVDGVIREIDSTDWAAFLANPMLMRSGYQGILAMRQHAAHPWFGTGAWSFRWLNINYIDQENPEEQQWLRSRLGVGQANVHNDTLQYLAEHGLVGFGLMIGCVAALVIPFLIQLAKSPGQNVLDAREDCCWLNRLNVAGVFIFVATALIALHSFIDLVFRSPACMMLYGLLFVCAPGCILGKRRTQQETTPHA